MKLFRASQSSVVHIEAVLTSNQSPAWPAKIFQRFIDTVVCKRCLSQSFIHQSTSCAKIIQKQFFAQIFQLFPVEPHCGMLKHKFSLPLSNKEGKNLLCKHCLYIFVVLFAWLQLFRCHVWPTFHPATPKFFVLASLFILIACWKTNFFLIFMGNYWERNGEREKFRLNKFPIVEAKSYILHCSAL